MPTYAQAQTLGVPWVPVNLAGTPVSVSVVDSYGVVVGSFVVMAGLSETLWLPIPADGGLELGGELLALTASGTNANCTFLSSGTNGWRCPDVPGGRRRGARE
jgi:hypothetical protein